MGHGKTGQTQTPGGDGPHLHSLPTSADLADLAKRLRKWAGKIEPFAEKQRSSLRREIGDFLHKSADDPPTVAGWYSAAADRHLESLSETLKEIAEVLGALAGSERSMRYPVAPNAPGWPPADTLCRIADELVELADPSAARPDGGNGKPERAAKRRKKDVPQHATTDAMITGALCIHHKYEEGQCGNREPATLDALRDILDKKVSKSTLSRYFKKFCRKNDRTQGYKRYQAACVGDRIGLCLKLLRGDAPIGEFLYGKDAPGGREGRQVDDE